MEKDLLSDYSKGQMPDGASGFDDADDRNPSTQAGGEVGRSTLSVANHAFNAMMMYKANKIMPSNLEQGQLRCTGSLRVSYYQ